jgi:beta-galactosidase
VAHTGDIDVTGFRRPQSYFREIVYGLRTDPYLVSHHPERFGREPVYSGPWSWPDVVSAWTWGGHEGRPVRVDVYAAGDEVELLVNGNSAGRRRLGEIQAHVASFDVVYEPGEVLAVAYDGGREVGRCSVRTASGPVRLTARVDRDEITASADDLAFVDISVADDSGTVDHGACLGIDVEVEGPAVLVGLISPDPRTTDPLTGPSCSTFAGRALAVIRPTGPGDIAVRISSDGLGVRTVSVRASSAE